MAIVFRDTELTVVKDSTLVAPEPTLMVTEPLVLAGVVDVGDCHRRHRQGLRQPVGVRRRLRLWLRGNTKYERPHVVIPFSISAEPAMKSSMAEVLPSTMAFMSGT